MWERNFPWHLHSIKENETNFLQNEINGPQNDRTVKANDPKIKANEMAEPQNERKIKVNEIIFNQNDRTVKENEIKIKANDMTGPQNVRKFEQNEVMALQNDPTASKMTQRQSLPIPLPHSGIAALIEIRGLTWGGILAHDTGRPGSLEKNRFFPYNLCWCKTRPQEKQLDPR